MRGGKAKFVNNKGSISSALRCESVTEEASIKMPSEKSCLLKNAGLTSLRSGLKQSLLAQSLSSAINEPIILQEASSPGFDNSQCNVMGSSLLQPVSSRYEPDVNSCISNAEPLTVDGTNCANNNNCDLNHQPVIVGYWSETDEVSKDGIMFRVPLANAVNYDEGLQNANALEDMGACKTINEAELVKSSTNVFQINPMRATLVQTSTFSSVPENNSSSTQRTSTYSNSSSCSQFQGLFDIFDSMLESSKRETSLGSMKIKPCSIKLTPAFVDDKIIDSSREPAVSATKVKRSKKLSLMKSKVNHKEDCILRNHTSCIERQCDTVVDRARLELLEDNGVSNSENAVRVLQHEGHSQSTGANSFNNFNVSNTRDSSLLPALSVQRNENSLSTNHIERKNENIDLRVLPHDGVITVPYCSPHSNNNHDYVSLSKFYASKFDISLIGRERLSLPKVSITGVKSVKILGTVEACKSTHADASDTLGQKQSAHLTKSPTLSSESSNIINTLKRSSISLKENGDKISCCIVVNSANVVSDAKGKKSKSNEKKSPETFEENYDSEIHDMEVLPSSSVNCTNNISSAVSGKIRRSSDQRLAVSLKENSDKDMENSEIMPSIFIVTSENDTLLAVDEKKSKSGKKKLAIEKSSDKNKGNSAEIMSSGSIANGANNASSLADCDKKSENGNESLAASLSENGVKHMENSKEISSSFASCTTDALSAVFGNKRKSSMEFDEAIVSKKKLSRRTVQCLPKINEIIEILNIPDNCVSAKKKVVKQKNSKKNKRNVSAVGKEASNIICTANESQTAINVCKSKKKSHSRVKQCNSFAELTHICNNFENISLNCDNGLRKSFGVAQMTVPTNKLAMQSDQNDCHSVKILQDMTVSNLQSGPNNLHILSGRVDEVVECAVQIGQNSSFSVTASPEKEAELALPNDRNHSCPVSVLTENMVEHTLKSGVVISCSKAILSEKAAESALQIVEKDSCSVSVQIDKAAELALQSSENDTHSVAILNDTSESGLSKNLNSSASSLPVDSEEAVMQNCLCSSQNDTFSEIIENEEMAAINLCEKDVMEINSHNQYESNLVYKADSVVSEQCSFLQADDQVNCEESIVSEFTSPLRDYEDMCVIDSDEEGTIGYSDSPCHFFSSRSQSFRRCKLGSECSWLECEKCLRVELQRVDLDQIQKAVDECRAKTKGRPRKKGSEKSSLHKIDEALSKYCHDDEIVSVKKRGRPRKNVLSTQLTQSLSILHDFTVKTLNRSYINNLVGTPQHENLPEICDIDINFSVDSSSTTTKNSCVQNNGIKVKKVKSKNVRGMKGKGNIGVAKGNELNSSFENIKSPNRQTQNMDNEEGKDADLTYNLKECLDHSKLSDAGNSSNLSYASKPESVIGASDCENSINREDTVTALLQDRLPGNFTENYEPQERNHFAGTFTENDDQLEGDHVAATFTENEEQQEERDHSAGTAMENDDQLERNRLAGTNMENDDQLDRVLVESIMISNDGKEHDSPVEMSELESTDKSENEECFAGDRLNRVSDRLGCNESPVLEVFSEKETLFCKDSLNNAAELYNHKHFAVQSDWEDYAYCKLAGECEFARSYSDAMFKLAFMSPYRSSSISLSPPRPVSPTQTSSDCTKYAPLLFKTPFAKMKKKCDDKQRVWISPIFCPQLQEEQSLSRVTVETLDSPINSNSEVPFDAQSVSKELFVPVEDCSMSDTFMRNDCGEMNSQQATINYNCNEMLSKKVSVLQATGIKKNFSMKTKLSKRKKDVKSDCKISSKSKLRCHFATASKEVMTNVMPEVVQGARSALKDNGINACVNVPIKSQLHKVSIGLTNADDGNILLKELQASADELNLDCILITESMLADVKQVVVSTNKTSVDVNKLSSTRLSTTACNVTTNHQVTHCVTNLSTNQQLTHCDASMNQQTIKCNSNASANQLLTESDNNVSTNHLLTECDNNALINQQLTESDNNVPTHQLLTENNVSTNQQPTQCDVNASSIIGRADKLQITTVDSVELRIPLEQICVTGADKILADCLVNTADITKAGNISKELALSQLASHENSASKFEQITECLQGSNNDKVLISDSNCLNDSVSITYVTNVDIIADKQVCDSDVAEITISHAELSLPCNGSSTSDLINLNLLDEVCAKVNAVCEYESPLDGLDLDLADFMCTSGINGTIISEIAVNILAPIDEQGILPEAVDIGQSKDDSSDKNDLRTEEQPVNEESIIDEKVGCLVDATPQFNTLGDCSNYGNSNVLTLTDDNATAKDLQRVKRISTTNNCSIVNRINLIHSVPVGIEDDYLPVYQQSDKTTDHGNFEISASFAVDAIRTSDSLSVLSHACTDGSESYIENSTQQKIKSSSILNFYPSISSTLNVDIATISSNTAAVVIDDMLTEVSNAVGLSDRITNSTKIPDSSAVNVQPCQMLSSLSDVCCNLDKQNIVEDSVKLSSGSFTTNQPLQNVSLFEGTALDVNDKLIEDLAENIPETDLVVMDTDAEIDSYLALLLPDENFEENFEENFDNDMEVSNEDLLDAYIAKDNVDELNSTIVDMFDQYVAKPSDESALLNENEVNFFLHNKCTKIGAADQLSLIDGDALGNKIALNETNHVEYALSVENASVSQSLGSSPAPLSVGMSIVASPGPLSVGTSSGPLSVEASSGPLSVGTSSGPLSVGASPGPVERVCLGSIMRRVSIDVRNDVCENSQQSQYSDVACSPLSPNFEQTIDNFQTPTASPRFVSNMLENSGFSVSHPMLEESDRIIIYTNPQSVRSIAHSPGCVETPIIPLHPQAVRISKSHEEVLRARKLSKLTAYHARSSNGAFVHQSVVSRDHMQKQVSNEVSCMDRCLKIETFSPSELMCMPNINNCLLPKCGGAERSSLSSKFHTMPKNNSGQTRRIKLDVDSVSSLCNQTTLNAQEERLNNENDEGNEGGSSREFNVQDVSSASVAWQCFVPSKSPPSREHVRRTLLNFGLAEMSVMMAHCSDVRDLPAKPR